MALKFPNRVRQRVRIINVSGGGNIFYVWLDPAGLPGYRTFTAADLAYGEDVPEPDEFHYCIHDEGTGRYAIGRGRLASEIPPGGSAAETCVQITDIAVDSTIALSEFSWANPNAGLGMRPGEDVRTMLYGSRPDGADEIIPNPSIGRGQVYIFISPPGEFLEAIHGGEVETADPEARRLIAAEQTAREQADTALGTRIDSEVLTLAQADNTNANAIAAETTARQAATTALGTRIDELPTPPTDAHIDERAKAQVADWAEPANTDDVPRDKLPAATTEAAGVVELATDDEAAARTAGKVIIGLTMP